MSRAARNWWYSPQSSAQGQTATRIRDLVSYFAWAGGLPAIGEKFRVAGEKESLGYCHTIEGIDEKSGEFTFRTGGAKCILWLDWLIYEPAGPGKKERTPPVRAANKPRKPKQTKKKDTAPEPSNWAQFPKLPPMKPGDREREQAELLKKYGRGEF